MRSWDERVGRRPTAASCEESLKPCVQPSHWQNDDDERGRGRGRWLRMTMTMMMKFLFDGCGRYDPGTNFQNFRIGGSRTHKNPNFIPHYSPRSVLKNLDPTRKHIITFYSILLLKRIAGVIWHNTCKMVYSILYTV